MAATAKICHKCQQPIIGFPYPEGKYSYCYECFQVLQQEKTEKEQEKEVLYTTIRRIFGVPEIPGEIVEAIDRELRNGKKIKGLEATIRYFYEITGHPVGQIDYLVVVMRDQYENARKYAKRVSEVTEYNRTAPLTTDSVTIKVTSESLYKTKKKIPYNIEDL